MTWKQLFTTMGLSTAGLFALFWCLSDFVLAKEKLDKIEGAGCNLEELLQLQPHMDGTQLTNLTMPQQTLVDLCHQAFEETNDAIQGINNASRASGLSLAALIYVIALQVMASAALAHDFCNESLCNELLKKFAISNLLTGAIFTAKSYDCCSEWLYPENIPNQTDQDLMLIADTKDKFNNPTNFALVLLAADSLLFCSLMLCRLCKNSNRSNDNSHSSELDAVGIEGADQTGYRVADDEQEDSHRQNSSPSSRFNFCQRIRSWCCSWFATEATEDSSSYSNQGLSGQPVDSYGYSG